MSSTLIRIQNEPSSFFCQRSVVEKLIEGKRIALVGSGPGSLDNPRGFVDSHDVVVRVNNHKCGEGPGFRTDIHYSFYGSSIKKTAEELIAEGVVACWSRLPDCEFMQSEWHTRRGKLLGVDYRPHYEKRKGWWFCPTYCSTVEELQDKFDLLGGHMPTTGFSALLDVLSCNPRNVFLTGYDFFQTGIHNVNERWKSGHPGDPIGHRPDVEREWFAANVKGLPITMDALLAQAVSGHVAPRVKAAEPNRRPIIRRRIQRAGRT